MRAYLPTIRFGDYPTEPAQKVAAEEAAGIETVRLLPSFEVVEVDHHFAPGPEKLAIKVKLAGASRDEKLELRVFSGKSFAEGPVFARLLSVDERADGERTIEWDGKVNQKRGPLKEGALVSPPHGPYTVVLTNGAQTSAVADKQVFFVLVHSLELSRGSYLEDDAAPPSKGGDGVKWMQHRLNELGWFAGPVDGKQVGNAQLKRAINRFRYETPGLEEVSDDHDDLADNPFLDALEKASPRDFLSEPKVVGDATLESKVWIEHNYWYPATDDSGVEDQFGTRGFALADAHVTREREKLDRFELVLRAKPLLVGKADKDLKGKGVACPKALTDLEVEWEVVIPPEDVSLLPEHTKEHPSNARAYIKLVRAQVAGSDPDVTKPKATDHYPDNCPVAQGGFQESPHKHASYFAPSLLAYEAAERGGRFFVKAHADEAKQGKLGLVEALFRGSHIAGDRLRVRAKASFEKAEEKQKLEKAHADLAAATAFDGRPVETGTFVVWRRRRVTGWIDWTSETLSAITWDEVAPRYREAHNELDVSAAQKLSIDELLDGPAKDLWLDCWAADSGTPKDQLQFRADQISPTPDLPRQPDQTAQAYMVAVSCTAAVSMKVFNGTYRGFNKDSRDPRPGGLCVLLRKALDKTHPPGAVVIRMDAIAPREIPGSQVRSFGRTKTGPSDQYWDGETPWSIGMPRGFAIVSRIHRKVDDEAMLKKRTILNNMNGMPQNWRDGFIVAHEMAHSQWLTHSYNTAACEIPDDHDTGDLNCLMCYPQQLVRANYRPPEFKLTPGSAYTMHFCGKCLLKLRGWKVRGGLPAQSRTKDQGVLASK